MAVRGAPAIGVAAAYGAAFSHAQRHATPAADVRRRRSACSPSTRPTAVNLFAALERMERAFERVARPEPARGDRGRPDRAKPTPIAAEDIAACRAHRPLRRGAPPRRARRVLTHCNAGALATAGYGTALGVIRGAVEAGKRDPRHRVRDAAVPAGRAADGVGARAGRHPRRRSSPTAWPGTSCRAGGIDAVVVGADRIAANGDVANKIGTYSLAVLAQRTRHPVLRRGAHVDHRPRTARRRSDPDRGARRRGGHCISRARASRRRASARRASRLRRDARPLRHGHRDRPGRSAGRPISRASRGAGRRGARGTVRPPP